SAVNAQVFLGGIEEDVFADGRDFVAAEGQLYHGVLLLGHAAAQSQVVAEIEHVGHGGFECVGLIEHTGQIHPLRTNAALHGVARFGAVDIEAGHAAAIGQSHSAGSAGTGRHGAVQHGVVADETGDK